MRNVTTSAGCLKCKGCCYFQDNHDAELAPFFTRKEMSRVPAEGLRIVSDGLWQGRVVSSEDPSYKYACTFLDESSYRCRIYEDRPIDCVTWPFIVSERDGVLLLCSASADWCPAVDGKNILDTDLVNAVIEYLKKVGYFAEIRSGERKAWPLEDSYIIIRDISEFFG